MFHRVFWKKLLLHAYHFKIYWAGTLRLVSNEKKNNHIFKFLQNFWLFCTFMKILINFPELKVCMTAEFCHKSIVTSWNIQIFSNFLTELKSIINFLPFETFPGAIAFFLWKWHANKLSFFVEENLEKLSLLQGDFCLIFCQSLTI